MADPRRARFRTAANQLRTHRQRWTETLLLAGITGAITGLAVAAFDAITANLLLEHILTLPTPLLAAMPGLGLLIAWLALRYLGHGASPTTSDEYIHNFHERDRSMDLRPFPARLVASIATLGLGGAMGFEGPSIYLGAAIGTWLHRRFRRVFSVEDAKLLLAVGAAAGVAAIFKTPLTGALFAVEVPYQQDQARRVALPALIGAVTSYVAFVLVQGATPVIPVAGFPSFDIPDLAGALAVGILCGLGARGFVWLVRNAKSMHARMAPWTFLAGAVILAILVPLTVSLYDLPLSIGPGYEVVRWVERPSVDVWLLAVLFLLRALATTATIGGGGAGGTFIPLVVQGAVLGRFVAAVAGVSQVTLLPLVGAAAFLGAGYRVPITAVVFVAESTGRPGFIVPGVLATVVAQLLMGNASITPYQRRMRGGHIEQRLQLRVTSAMRSEWVPLRPDDPLDARIEAAFVRTKTLTLPVVGSDGSYEGMVRLADVAAVRAGQREGEHVRDLLVVTPLTRPNATLLEAIGEMDEHELDCLAVGAGERIDGIVTRDDALRLDEILARSRGNSDSSGG